MCWWTMGWHYTLLFQSVAWHCAVQLVEKFQTIIAAFIALGGVYFTVVPSWRQVAILQGQRVDQIRERLAAEYRMIAEAIELLDDAKWREDSAFSKGLKPEQMADSNLVPELIAGYQDRVARWATIVAGLRQKLDAEQLAAIQPDLDMVEGRFAETETVPTQNWTSGHIPGAGPHSNTGLHWMAAAYPDMMVYARMAEARSKLADMQGVIVDKMVQPSPR